MSTLGSRVAGLLSRLWDSRLARNALSNYLAVAWTALLSLAVIPIYVRTLGAGEWGVVAACMTLQGFLTLLDAGFGQILPRSLARVSGDPSEEARVFRAYDRIYATLAVAGFAGGQLLAGVAARRWFQASGVDAAHLELSLRVVLVQFLFQFANGVHVGFWSGMQLQEEGNLRTTGFVTLRHAAALASVLLLSPSALGYLVPFAVVCALEWGANRAAIRRRHLRDLGAVEVRRGEIAAIVREAGTFTAAILVGLLVSQADRIVLSRSQSLTHFGYYVIVANLAMAFMNLHGPLTRAYFPRIAAEDARGERGGQALRHLLLGVLVACVLPCLAAAAAAPALLSAWLHDPAIVAAGTLPLRLLLLAVALNALYGVAYTRMLSRGAGRTAIVVNVAALGAVALTTALDGGRLGIALGGAIWLASAGTQLALGLAWATLNRRWTPRAA